MCFAMVLPSRLMSSVLTHSSWPRPAARRKTIETRYATAQELLKLSAGQPVVEEGVDVGDGGLDLLLPSPEEINDADLHGVVLQLGLVDDALPERQQDVSIVPHAVLCPFYALAHRLGRRAQ